VFAVILYKGGIASALGHNHFIVSEGYTTEILADPADLTRTAFSITVPAAKLVADHPDVEKAWFDAVDSAGLVGEAFPVQPEERRAEIAEHMLDENQLDAANYPEIHARIMSIEAKAKTIEGVDYPYTAHLAFTVKDQTVEREAAAKISIEDGVLHVEAVAEFKFTDFGINPFKIAFGAVGNKDPFKVYVNFKATPTSEAAEAEK
jgi:polyisoprenoid-binding protein YceI